MKPMALLAVATISLAACGGGGTNPAPIAAFSAPTLAPITTTPTTAPVVAPTAAPTASSVGNLPLSEAVAGTLAWVDPSTHKTLYFLDVDTTTGGTCTAACLAVWPVFKPATGSVASGSMTIITRSDGTGTQWAYAGKPLYTFSGDTGADQTAGDNFPDFGGHWHVVRPASATPAPVGGATAPPCIGYYC